MKSPIREVHDLGRCFGTDRLTADTRTAAIKGEGSALGIIKGSGGFTIRS
jgi:hypothetical protein